MERRYRDLPEDCWELILNRLPHHSDFNPVSLVCKQFLKLTNQLCPKLIVTNALILTRTHNYISLLINKRFPNLNSIDFSNCSWNIEGLLLRMANNCALEKLREIDLSNVKKVPIKGLIALGSKMRGIRVLKCSKARVFRDEDLVGIAKLLPFLEELDISYPRNVDLGRSSGGVTEMAITDAGIQVLAMNVKNLRKINVSGNDFVTDLSLVCLSENCVFLEGVDVVDCTMITAKGVLFVLRNSVHLNSISASGIDTKNRCLGSEDMSFSGRRLCSLDLRNSSISDEFMHMLVDVCIDLRRLSLYECSGFKVSSLVLLLRTCHTLQHLTLCELGFAIDESIVKLFPSLPNVFTLFTFKVAKCCPSLEFVKMECPESGIRDLKDLDSLKYANIKSLNLSRSYNLVNKFLNGIALACPNLEILDISNCTRITESCLAEILDTCHEIRILSITGCQMNSIGKGSVLPKLEVLDAAHSAINDEGLAQIAIRCPKVEKLGLAGCYHVRDTGVEEVLRSCQILKEINLWLCPKVDTISMVPWMISTRPTLVKIVPPFHMLISNREKRSYLQHGCQILNGSKYRIPKIWE